MTYEKKQLSLRINKTMDEAIESASRKIGVTKNAFILYAIDKILREDAVKGEVE